MTIFHRQALADDLAARLLAAPRVLCIVNSRRHARELYEAIKSGGDAFHLSTLMCANHRRDVLATIRARLRAGLPVHLVSTSLIEAGVDISFPIVLRAEAGFSLVELNRLFMPRGWFSPVTPGTKFVTLGGMVASDVHGKNHHVEGCFGEHVLSLRLRLGSGEIVTCSREEHPDLFRATLGGMGLTGHILTVTFRMAPIPSPWILQETVRLPDLDTLLDGLKEAAGGWPMTMAWIDGIKISDRDALIAAGHDVKALASDTIKFGASIQLLESRSVRRSASVKRLRDLLHLFRDGQVAHPILTQSVIEAFEKRVHKRLIEPLRFRSKVTQAGTDQGYNQHHGVKPGGHGRAGRLAWRAMIGRRPAPAPVPAPSGAGAQARLTCGALMPRLPD